MIENQEFNAFIVELNDFRLNKAKECYEVKYSISDTYSGDFTKNSYKYFTNKSRSSDEFIMQFMLEVNKKVGEYIFKIDKKLLISIEDRHLLLFHVRPYKRINMNIKRLLYLLIKGQKYSKMKNGAKLLLNDTHLYLTQGYLLISPVDKSELNMQWYKKYLELQDYNLVQL
jgi:hypothetical protein